jgi:hypothetical protein
MDTSAIRNQAAAATDRFEETLYRVAVKLSGNASYQPPMVNVFEIRGDRPAIESLARSVSFEELANFIESLTLRLLAAESEIEKLKSLGGSKKNG